MCDKKPIIPDEKIGVVKPSGVQATRLYKPYMDRDTFMKYWRNTEWVAEHLTVDDRMEIFQSAPVGSSDITYKNLSAMISEYDGGEDDFILEQNHGQFNITSVHRDDIRNSYPDIPDKVIDTISDEIMEKLARKMADDYCEQLFHDSLTTIVDDCMDDEVFSERNTCTNCGKDTSREGFVNRIGYCGSYKSKKEDGCNFPEGGYICGPCSAEMDDDVDCDHCEITINREESHDVGKETLCGNCFVKVETDSNGKPIL